MSVASVAIIGPVTVHVAIPVVIVIIILAIISVRVPSLHVLAHLHVSWVVVLHLLGSYRWRHVIVVGILEAAGRVVKRGILHWILLKIWLLALLV